MVGKRVKDAAETESERVIVTPRRREMNGGSGSGGGREEPSDQRLN